MVFFYACADCTMVAFKTSKPARHHIRILRQALPLLAHATRVTDRLLLLLEGGKEKKKATVRLVLRPSSQNPDLSKVKLHRKVCSSLTPPLTSLQARPLRGAMAGRNSSWSKTVCDACCARSLFPVSLLQKIRNNRQIVMNLRVCVDVCCCSCDITQVLGESSWCIEATKHVKL